MKQELMHYTYITAFLFMFSYIPVMHGKQCTSENYTRGDTLKKTGQNVSILFWNVENLYDPQDDTSRRDEEFTSAGYYHWTWSRLYAKLNHVAKTILAAGKWEPPAIIGVCEIENRRVLQRLIYDTPLKIWQYRIIHFDSPDVRGIDVACIYRPAIFKPLVSHPIVVKFPFDTLATTRDILYIKGLLANRDTLHLFINHWPSRRGGEETSRHGRNHAAFILRNVVDSILAITPRTSLLIMGDFNDEPNDESLRSVLRAGEYVRGDTVPHLVNLMLPKVGKDGTHKFQGHWGILDQFIVSSAMLEPDASTFTSYSMATIFKPQFVLQEDNRYFGSKPSRTYVGPRYSGGFSDHLLVRIEIHVMNIKSDE